MCVSKADNQTIVITVKPSGQTPHVCWGECLKTFTDEDGDKVIAWG